MRGKLNIFFGGEHECFPGKCSHKIHDVVRHLTIVGEEGYLGNSDEFCGGGVCMYFWDELGRSRGYYNQIRVIIALRIIIILIIPGAQLPYHVSNLFNYKMILRYTFRAVDNINSRL